MDKKFINVVDQDVAVYMVYADSTGKACSDVDCEVQLTAEELRHVFYVGCVIVVDDVEYKPVALEIADGVVTVSYIVPNGTTSTSADLATVVSA